MSHLKKSCVAVTAVILVLAVLITTRAPAKEVAPATFYKGKTITFIVPYGAGGGYDAYARLIAPYLAKYTGAATTLVENKPGAMGNLALNYLYNQAKPDGLTVLIGGGDERAWFTLMGVKEGVKHDFMKFEWLGRVVFERSVIMANPKGPYTTVAAIQKATKPIKGGGAGKADGQLDTLCLMAYALGVDAKPILGYKGSKEAMLAVMRGETDLCFASESAAIKHIKGGNVVPVCILDASRSPLLPNVPTIFETGKVSAEAKKYIDLRSNVRQIQREIWAPPGVPKDRVAFLRDAIRKSLHDPEFLAKAKKGKRRIAYLTGDEAKKLAITIMKSLSDDEVKKFRYIVMEKYYK